MVKNRRIIVSIIVIILGLVIVFLFMNFKSSNVSINSDTIENNTEKEENIQSNQNVQKDDDETISDITLNPDQEIREPDDNQTDPGQADTEVEFEE